MSAQPVHQPTPFRESDAVGEGSPDPARRGMLPPPRFPAHQRKYRRHNQQLHGAREEPNEPRKEHGSGKVALDEPAHAIHERPSSPEGIPRSLQCPEPRAWDLDVNEWRGQTRAGGGVLAGPASDHSSRQRVSTGTTRGLKYLIIDPKGVPSQSDRLACTGPFPGILSGTTERYSHNQFSSNGFHQGATPVSGSSCRPNPPADGGSKEYVNR